jgi:hypothetical protein
MTVRSGRDYHIYPSLNQVLSEYDLLSIQPLFTPGSPLKNIFLFTFPTETDVDKLVSVLVAMPFIELVEKHSIMQIDRKPNDYYFNRDFWPPPAPPDGQLDQWTFYTMQLNRAWDITRGDSSVVVGVIDTGLDWLHPDMDRTVWINTHEDINGSGAFENWPDTVTIGGLTGDLNRADDDPPPGNFVADDVIGFDFFELDADPYPDLDDQGNHGTHVSSFISAETDNNYGVAGGTWFSRIMALKVGTEDGIKTGPIINAINYAVANGAHVVNMSFGGPNPSTAMHQAIITGTQQGVIFVASAKDENTDDQRYPGSHPEVIRVAVVDSSGFKTLGSNYGTDVAICAPAAPTGAADFGTVAPTFDDTASASYPGDQPPHLFRHTQVATSDGAAEVTAAIALLKAVYFDSSAAFIEHELLRGAEPLPDTLYSQGKLGAGMANPFRSLTQWGHISSDTTWSGTVYVSGDIVVDSAVTLTIDAGTNVIVWNDDVNHAINPEVSPAEINDTTRCEIWVKGFLDVNGTQSFPVTFSAFDSSGTSDDTDAWFGIFVWDNQGAGADFDYCHIENALRGIQSRSFVNIRNCVIEKCAWQGISVAYADSVFIENTTIRGPEESGLRLGLATARISNSTIEDVDDYGVWVRDGSVLYADSTKFLDGEVGVYVFPDSEATATAYLDYCTIKHNDKGVQAVDSAAVELHYCVIDSNATLGVYCGDRADALFRNNSIKENGIGVHCYDADPVLRRGNMIEDCNAGLICAGESNAVVESTTIATNLYGVLAINDSEPDLGHVSGGSSNGYNSIHHNSFYHVQNLTSDTLMAERNWWRGEEPDTSKFLGGVDWVPWLADEPEIEPEEDPGAVSPFEDGKMFPVAYEMSYGYPNPCNPTTTVRLEIPVPGGYVGVTVYNLKGQVVRRLVRENMVPGSHVVTWDGRDDRGHSVASGIYFVQMRAPGFTKAHKIALLK